MQEGYSFLQRKKTLHPTLKSNKFDGKIIINSRKSFKYRKNIYGAVGGPNHKFFFINFPNN